jgi:hypothetical protein
MSDERVELAAQAYIYGYPLVADLDAVTQFVHRGLGGLAAAPFNEFAHADRLAGPADQFVSVNNDTIYSIAQLDLSGGPLWLHLPDTGGRYTVFQLVDAWTNNFAYLGSRGSGGGVVDHLLVPPGTTGARPGAIEVPTTVASIVGRFACDGPQDLPGVAALQRELRLTPVNPDASLRGVPHPDERVPAPLHFFEKLRLWQDAFPPSHWDQEYQERFAPIGLLDSPSPYVGADPALVEDLARGVKAGQARLEQLSRGEHGQAVNGWLVDLHLFDYNLDHLGPGTNPDPQWKIHPRAQAYLTRALAARVGLWGNHAYEAVYAQVFEDSQGRPLSGVQSYTMRFEQPPPSDAFWSVTMYEVPAYHLVDNPADRYSIGDRTPGLRYEPDGSLTVVLQHEAPTDPDERANWLPTPAGEFRPILRVYRPGSLVLDGAYPYPPIVARDRNF